MAPNRPSHVLSVLPYVVMAVVVVVHLTAGSGVGYLPLISLGPAFAGLVGGWLRTAWIGTLALALTLGLGLHNDLLGHRRGLTALVSVTGVTVAGLVAAVMRQRREAEFANVRSIAEVAQRVLLRPVPLTAGPLRVALSYTSAVADARIGGDLYEVVATPYGVRTIVGDVQGKGLEAVETAAVVLGAFREAAYDEPVLTAVGERLEHALDRHLTAEKFVTAVLAESGPERSMTLLNFGHPAPLLVRQDGTATFVPPPERALPLGLALPGTKSPGLHTLDFAPGDQVLFYTDGVSEARDTRGRFYPLDRRTALLRTADPQAAVEALRRDLVAHTGGPLHDDAAMLLVRYRDDETEPGPELGPEPGPEPEAGPGPGPEPGTELGPEAGPGPGPEPGAEPEPGAGRRLGLEAGPGAKPHPEPGPGAEFAPEPAPRPAPGFGPGPGTGTGPDPRPTRDPGPDPGTTFKT